VPVTAAVAVRPVARNTNSTTTGRSASTASNARARRPRSSRSPSRNDEDAALYAAEDIAEEDGDAYVIDARDVVEDATKPM